MLIKSINEKNKTGISSHTLPVFIEKKKLVKKKPDRALDLQKQLNEALQIIDELEDTLEVEREERFQAGFKTGKEEGYQQGLSEINSQIQMMAKTVAAIKQNQHEYIKSAEQFVVDFSLKIVGEMVESGFLEKQKLLVKKLSEFVKSALKKFPDAAKYILYVNIDTVPAVKENLENIKLDFQEKTNFTVVEGPSLAPGDCLIETDFGVLDGRIKTHFREILSAIEEPQE